MELIHSKSLLAKLMATENLTIEQRNVQTAAFDVKNRVLTVPILDKDISGYLYDLFMGHEVGHALYTPLSGMTKAYEEKIPMSIMNVLEDSRIERKIKTKYPGIRTSFIRAYKELIDKDFFGTNGTDLNDMNFIDRVNLYTKGGAAQNIKFNSTERYLVEKIESTETYDNVIEVAREVMEYMKEEQEKKKLMFDPDGEEELDEFSPEGYGDSDEDDWDEDTEERESKSQDNDWDEIDSNEDKPEQYGSNPEGHGESGSEDGIRSHTDESYRKNESKLFKNDNRAYYYGNIPTIDLNEAIFSYKKLWVQYKVDVSTFVERGYPNVTGLDIKGFQKLRNDSKKVVGYLSKEFELRKNADQMKRASIAKTGELNMNKIYAYNMIDDIFKKMTVIPGAKSHGLVMFLDWSGSMSNHMENTVKQLINLVMFCKKVNIPYEVYAFTSEFDRGAYSPKPKVGDICTHPYKLLNVLSSKMSAAEFTYAGSALVSLSQYRSFKPSWFQLGGTPLSEAIISAMTIIPHFQKQYKLQIVNTVFLTDGDGHSLKSVYTESPNGHIHSGYNSPELDGGAGYRMDKQFVIRDPMNRNEVHTGYSGREITSSYIKMLKKRTNCNIVGFYVLSGREFGRASYDFFPKTSNLDKYKSEFRKNKCLTVTNAGYDEYYLLRSEGLDTDDDVEFEVRENATTRGLVSAFSKYAGNRLSNRVVLNRFIGMIA